MRVRNACLRILLFRRFFTSPRGFSCIAENGLGDFIPGLVVGNWTIRVEAGVVEVAKYQILFDDDWHNRNR
jgi:hypothetical protein